MTPFLQLQSHSIPYYTSFPSGSVGKEFACQCRRLRRLGFNPRDQEDPLEKEMATHSSILAWETPRTEEPGGLRSTKSQKNQTQLSD